MSLTFMLSINISDKKFVRNTTRSIAQILATVQEELEGGATQNTIDDGNGNIIGGWSIQVGEEQRKCA